MQKDPEQWRNLRYDDPPVQLEQSMFRGSYGICVQRCRSGKHSKACPEIARRVWLSCAVDHLANTANQSIKCNSLRDQPRGGHRPVREVTVGCQPQLTADKVGETARGTKGAYDERSGGGPMTKCPLVMYRIFNLATSSHPSMRLTPLPCAKAKWGSS